MAVQDGHLTIGENFILQFLADLLGIGPRAFARLFERSRIARSPFPGTRAIPPGGACATPERHLEAGPDAWDRPAATARPASRLHRCRRPQYGDPLADAGDEGEPMSLAEAYQVLGLDHEAPHERSMPPTAGWPRPAIPTFAKLGPAAVATATFAFERLQEAYALLS